MINMFKALGHGQMEIARWVEKEYDKYQFIHVELVGDQEKRFSIVIQNLMTNSNNLLLRTADIYDYKPRQHVFYRDKWWEIKSVGDDMTAVNPQSLALVAGGTQQYILELGEVDGYDVK